MRKEKFLSNSIFKQKAGNQTIFENNTEKQVMIKKAKPIDIAYLKSLESILIEWSCQNDEEDYCDL